MKITVSLFLFLWVVCVYGQKNPYDYPDTLWIYGTSTDTNYGRTSSNPIKVGGGLFPKNNYRYLNSLADANGNLVKYSRIGSCRGADNRKEPLTCFMVETEGGRKFTIYFDQYEFNPPMVIAGYTWKEERKGYFGELKNDTVFEGKGVYFFEDGGYYKGEWVNGMMEGKGTMYVPDVEKYIGQFKAGEYNGLGTLYYSDGGRYEGNWKNGERQGFGKLFYPSSADIDYIEGNFEKGKAKGEFVVKMKNGETKKNKF